jgi:hypothetical protein
MMKKRTILRNTLAAGLVAACLALNANAGSQISGRVQIKTDVNVNKVETGRKAWVHLGAVNCLVPTLQRGNANLTINLPAHKRYPNK